MTMESIKSHIEKNKNILDDSRTSAQAKRHTQEELLALERWAETHLEDDHDPSSLELYCNDHPDALECVMYDV
jgi:hypothetical protein